MDVRKLILFHALVLIFTDAAFSPCQTGGDFCEDDYKDCPKLFTPVAPTNTSDTPDVNQQCIDLPQLATHCRKSCLSCCRLPQFSCKDKETVTELCKSVVESKLCTTTDPILFQQIKESCAQSCGLCSSGGCVDKISNCNKDDCDDDLAKALCPNTCNACNDHGTTACVDLARNCPREYCNNPLYAGLMSTLCKKTCNFCSGNCADTTYKCQEWARAGFCTRYDRQTVQRYCPRTCNMCPPY